MNNFARFLVAATSAAAFYAPASSAVSVTEKELNDTMPIAHGLGHDRAHTVAGAMGAGKAGHDDLDFFTFEATAGDVISLDIDGAFQVPGDPNTIIAIFDESGTMLRYNDNAPDVDEGSTHIVDARIDNFTVPATGTYTVGVSTWPRFFNMDGSTINPIPNYSNPAGDYTLNIEGVTMSVKQVVFEVKPGSKQLAPLNPSAKGRVPVAIFGAVDFDVSTIQQDSLTFGATGKENSLGKCQPNYKDINKDGYVDLLCHFDNQAAGFTSGDVEAKLKGKTKADQAFEGQSLLKVIPSHRKKK